MLKELSLLKWKEKATKLASEENATKMAELQSTLSSLEENVTTERQFHLNGFSMCRELNLQWILMMLFHREKIRENTGTLKEIETLHAKHVKRQEVYSEVHVMAFKHTHPFSHCL